jgi:hypothetical protein
LLVDEEEEGEDYMSDEQDEADSPSQTARSALARPARKQTVVEQAQEEEEEEDDPLMPKRYVNDRGIGVGEMRRSKFLAFTTGILVAGFGIALVVDELEVGE